MGELRISWLKENLSFRVDESNIARYEGEDQIVPDHAADNQRWANFRGREIGERELDQDNVPSPKRGPGAHTGSPSDNV